MGFPGSPRATLVPLLSDPRFQASAEMRSGAAGKAECLPYELMVVAQGRSIVEAIVIDGEGQARLVQQLEGMVPRVCDACQKIAERADFPGDFPLADYRRAR